MRDRNVQKADSWAPDPAKVRLIEWAISGAPESESLPEGAREILAARRRADLLEAWEAVNAFGPSAAEPIRKSNGLPEELTQQPEGIVTEVQAPRFADGIAELLVQVPEVIGHDARGFAITRGGAHWADREWRSPEDLRRYLYRQARNLLWKQMRREDRANAHVIRQQALQVVPHLARKQLLDDMQKCFGPIQRKMPELARYFRVLSATADPETGEVDWALVAKRYHVPEERIESFLETTILRQWQPELENLWLRLSLYVKRRKVRFDSKSENFQISDDAE